MKARFAGLTEECGISSHVHFAGYVPDKQMPAYYEACDLFAMPSTGEGFGLVYLEAMYHAKPCLAGTWDAASEVVRDGETGLLVEPGNVEQLTRALVELLTQPEHSKRLGWAGKERLEQPVHLRPLLSTASASAGSIRTVYVTVPHS